jgi:hypothetical protein
MRYRTLLVLTMFCTLSTGACSQGSVRSFALKRARKEIGLQLARSGDCLDLLVKSNAPVL